MKKRLDQLIVDLGLAPSRTKAQELIELGVVELKSNNPKTSKIATKPSELIDPDATKVSLKDTNLLKYVSRAGLKLESALKEVNVQVKGLEVLDLGVSTGGFSDCLLQSGVKSIFAVDVAQDETHEKIKNDQRVTLFLGVNARELSKVPEIKDTKFDLIVVDLSFISLSKIIPQLYDYLRANGFILALIKPQFEVGPKGLDKNGIVRDETIRSQAIENVRKLAAEIGFKNSSIFPAAIAGRDGNQEYFLYAKK